jgi:hypothetical protein
VAPIMGTGRATLLVPIIERNRQGFHTIVVGV